MLTLVQASQASGKITTKDLQILRTLCSEAVAEATVVPGPAKRLTPQRCPLRPCWKERWIHTLFMPPSLFDFVFFVVVVVERGRPPAGQVPEALGGFTR